MSILDDDVFEQAGRPITISILKNVPDEDIPVLLQAWYDVFENAIVKQHCRGYQLYPILNLYEDCYTGKTYRNFYTSTISSQYGKTVVYIMNPSSRQEYIDRWKQFMLSHVEDVVWTKMISERDTDLDTFFVSLSGVFNCFDLKDGLFRSPYTVATKFTGTTIEFCTVPSQKHPDHNYLFYKECIYRLLSDLTAQK